MADDPNRLETWKRDQNEALIRDEAGDGTAGELNTVAMYLLRLAGAMAAYEVRVFSAEQVAAWLTGNAAELHRLAHVAEKARK